MSIKKENDDKRKNGLPWTLLLCKSKCPTSRHFTSTLQSLSIILLQMKRSCVLPLFPREVKTVTWIVLKAQPKCDKITSLITPLPLNSVLLVLYVMFPSSICVSGWKWKCVGCTKTKVRHVYLFLLCAEGRCFHGDSLMASFASLIFVILLLQSLHICNISVWSLLMTIVPHAPLSSPTLYFSSLALTSISLSLWKTKWESRV